ncbi:putative quinol monooxygenase [Erwinia sp. HDF1-3R]|uniref:putative quinol monooxygenase n=1 Tax=Erwinia sp. HDF1-3R TaxID=3141543 RepID=UPI0031F570EE
MITLNVFFKVKPENKQELLAVLNNMVVESNKEEGCHFYQLWNNEDDKNHYALIELWSGKDVLSEHQKTPHWIAFNDVVNTFLTEPYDEHHFSEIAR